jgi:hypothetical protein
MWVRSAGIAKPHTLEDSIPVHTPASVVDIAEALWGVAFTRAASAVVSTAEEVTVAAIAELTGPHD